MSDLIELKSPFKKWPGSLWVPEIVDAHDYNTWWELFMQIEDEIDEGSNEKHATFNTWFSRFHLIKKSTMQLGKSHKGEAYELEQTGLKLPSPKVAKWFIEETDHLLDEATDLKN